MIAFRWYGGKYILKDFILPFPKHKYYFEVFGGSAALLLNKDKTPIECYNDINEDLVNFWNVLKDEPDFFERRSMLELVSSQIFYEYRDEKIDDPKERAYRFFYTITNSFSGVKTNFHGIRDRTQISFFSAIRRLKAIHYRIQNVSFYNMPYDTFMTDVIFSNPEYISEKTLIYLDPPYFIGGYAYNGINGDDVWDNREYYKLASILNEYKEKGPIFIISSDRYDWLDDGWFVKKISRLFYAKYSKNNENKKSLDEYIISNYNLDKLPKQSSII